jgi:RNA polymerase sigma-70 factor, ECF subfamily
MDKTPNERDGFALYAVCNDDSDAAFNDHSDFEAFYLAYLSKCRAAVWKRHRAARDRYRMSAGDYDDAVNDAVVGALQDTWRLRERYDPSKASLTTWITRIASRAFLKIMRGKVSLLPEQVSLSSLPVDKVVTTDPFHSVVVRETINDTFRRLPVTHTDALRACYEEGLTVSEAAERLGVTETVIHSRLQRARGSFARTWNEGESLNA